MDVPTPRDFGRAAPGWSVVRKPEPIQAGGHLVFPDFAVHPRHEPGARWLVEIVGFREARIANIVVCIDEERNVGPRDLPAAAGLVRYRRRVDPSAVLRAMRGE